MSIFLLTGIFAKGQWVADYTTNIPQDSSVIVLAVTALQSMASSATVGWKSVRINNYSPHYDKVEIFVTLTTSNNAPGNDKAMYIYLIPWTTTDGGTTWYAASGGTTTLPTSADATYTQAAPNNFILLGVLAYTTQNMTVQGTFTVTGGMPSGYSIFIENFGGAALSTGCIVDIIKEF